MNRAESATIFAALDRLRSRMRFGGRLAATRDERPWRIISHTLLTMRPYADEFWWRQDGANEKCRVCGGPAPIGAPTPDQLWMHPECLDLSLGPVTKRAIVR